MNWLDGLTLTWHWNGDRFKPWRTQIKTLFFWYFWSWLEYEKLRENPSCMAIERWLENSHNEIVNVINN